MLLSWHLGTQGGDVWGHGGGGTLMDTWGHRGAIFGDVGGGGGGTIWGHRSDAPAFPPLSPCRASRRRRVSAAPEVAGGTLDAVGAEGGDADPA